MESIKCGTSRCLNAITHYYAAEDCYYCQHCTLVMCNADECELIGKNDTANILINLCQDLLANINDYVSSHQLEISWKLVFVQLRQFEADLLKINTDLKSAIGDVNPKERILIQKRASDLKTQIIDSEVFLKYLVHKELNRLRFRELDEDNEQIIRKSAKIISEINTEEEKAIIKNIFKNVGHWLFSETTPNEKLEDLKFEHDNEINQLKRKHCEDEAKHDNEKEDMLNQRMEIEQEIKITQDKDTECNKEPQLISYEVNLIMKIQSLLIIIEIKHVN